MLHGLGEAPVRQGLGGASVLHGLGGAPVLHGLVALTTQHFKGLAGRHEYANSTG